MSNSSVLAQSHAQLKAIMRAHLGTELQRFLKALVDEVTLRRRSEDHHQTGNTINAYMGVLYYNGKAIAVASSSDKVRAPLRPKYSKGVYLPVGLKRWSGRKRFLPYKTKIETDQSTEPQGALDFAKDFTPETPNGYTIMICNGVEYAQFQERQLNIDVLTQNYLYAKSKSLTFTPLPDI